MQLSASVGDIAGQVAKSAESAVQAAIESKRTDAWIEELDQAAGRIGHVVRLIGDIAAQTNLLALNATIEAARAGAAGRGFAVVAEEVKSLAAQTALATREIAGQIAAMQSAAQGSISAVRDISRRIDEISGLAADVAVAVTTQREAAADIANSVQDVVRGTGLTMDSIDKAVEAATTASGSVGVVARIVEGLPERRREVGALLSRADSIFQARAP